LLFVKYKPMYTGNSRPILAHPEFDILSYQILSNPDENGTKFA